MKFVLDLGWFPLLALVLLVLKLVGTVQISYWILILIAATPILIILVIGILLSIMALII